MGAPAMLAVIVWAAVATRRLGRQVPGAEPECWHAVVDALLSNRTGVLWGRPGCGTGCRHCG